MTAIKRLFSGVGQVCYSLADLCCGLLMVAGFLGIVAVIVIAVLWPLWLALAALKYLWS